MEQSKTKRKPRIYPAPDDGREWITLHEAAALAEVLPGTLLTRARKQEWTRVSLPARQTWLLKKDFDFYLNFVKLRERWYKNHKPKSWRPNAGVVHPNDVAYVESNFWTPQQAADFLGIAPKTLNSLARRGRLPVWLTGKVGRGRRHWYCPTATKNYKEDETRQKYLARWEKTKATIQQGTVVRKIYLAQHRARQYPTIPEEWITIREVAEILEISLSSVVKLRQRGALDGYQWLGEWGKRRPWFFRRTTVEEYMNSEHYQQTRARGRKALQAAVNRHTETPDLPNGEESERTRRSVVSFGYTNEELYPDWNKI